MPCRAVKEFLVGMGFDADSVSAVLREEPDVDRALALLLSQADSSPPAVVVDDEEGEDERRFLAWADAAGFDTLERFELAEGSDLADLGMPFKVIDATLKRLALKDPERWSSKPVVAISASSPAFVPAAGIPATAPAAQAEQPCIPCEVCACPIPIVDLNSHQAECHRALSSSAVVESTTRHAAAQPEDNDFVPCEFCDVPFPLASLEAHQGACRQQPRLQPKQQPRQQPQPQPQQQQQQHPPPQNDSGSQLRMWRKQNLLPRRGGTWGAPVSGSKPAGSATRRGRLQQSRLSDGRQQPGAGARSSSADCLEDEDKEEEEENPMFPSLPTTAPQVGASGNVSGSTSWCLWCCLEFPAGQQSALHQELCGGHFNRSVTDRRKQQRVAAGQMKKKVVALDGFEVITCGLVGGFDCEEDAYLDQVPCELCGWQVDVTTMTQHTEECWLSSRLFCLPPVNPWAPAAARAASALAATALVDARRTVVLDGSNIAHAHSRDGYFSADGLRIACEYWMKRGHLVIAVVPAARMFHAEGHSQPHTGLETLAQLRRDGIVHIAPARDNDDLYVLHAARREVGSTICSNDRFKRELACMDVASRKVFEPIVRKAVGFRFEGDEFCVIR